MRSAKTLFQRSGFDVLVTMLLAWLVTKIPQWVGWLHLDPPMDEAISDVAAILCGWIRLTWLQKKYPSVDGAALERDRAGL